MSQIFDYNSITELPGSQISNLQLNRSFQRYAFARTYANNGKLIEIGCILPRLNLFWIFQKK